MSVNRTMKSALESMMFTWGEPLDIQDAADALNMSWQDVYDGFTELQKEYEEEQRGIRIRRIRDGFQFVTCSDNADYIRTLCTPVKVRRLSQAALEVLAIIAYKQPVTRGEIDSIRGIRCDRVMEGLMTRELVEEKGRSKAIGRPVLYGTTDRFLRYFGLSDISELPEIEDIESALTEQDPAARIEPEQITLDLGE